MNTIKRNMAGLVFCLLSATAVQAQVKGDAAKGKEVVDKVCIACHGPDGNSPVPNFPKLAGTHASYLLKQLEDFKKKRRHSDIMAPIVTELSDADMANLAVYFSEQKAAPGVVGNPALLDAGKQVWNEGNPKSGVPACSGCHGEKGQGDERYPRLAGQYVEYTTMELNLFRESKRKNDKKLMQAVADRMTEQEIKAVAEYIASLP